LGLLWVFSERKTDGPGANKGATEACICKRCKALKNEKKGVGRLTNKKKDLGVIHSLVFWLTGKKTPGKHRGIFNTSDEKNRRWTTAFVENTAKTGGRNDVGEKL